MPMYKNNLSSFKRWCKINKWNSVYENEKEYHKLNNGVYLELSISDHSNLYGEITNFSVYPSFRYYENNDFPRFSPAEHEELKNIHSDVIEDYRRELKRRGYELTNF